jgi:hypothetical protein
MGVILLSTGCMNPLNRVCKYTRRENSVQLYHYPAQKSIYKSTPQGVYSTKLFPTIILRIPYSLLRLLPAKALGPFEYSRDSAQGIN